MELFLIFSLYLLISLFLYNYFIYPAGIIFISKLVNNKHKPSSLDSYPSVSFIIAAYNEDKVIREKIINTLELDYPEDKFQIIIVSDGSDDNTPKIANEYADSNFIAIHDAQRNGKSSALNRAVEFATGEILVFSDANNDFSKNAIHELVKHFSDVNIAAVTGSKRIYKNSDRQSAEGDDLYWKYESAIKQAESHLGSITAAEGEILAVRKSSFNPIDPTLINDDAAITFDIVKSGSRIIYESNAIAYEEASKNIMDDLRVKIRMTSGGFQTIVREFAFLFPPLSWFSFTFWSHKILRWLAPHFMILILLLSVLLSHRADGLFLLITQLLFYAISFYGWRNRESDLPSYIYIPMYFTSMNIALFIGFIKFLAKKQNVQWTKAER